MLSINPKLLYVRNQKTGKFVPLVAIIGPKGPPGTIDNITDYLTNEKGDSEELAMSQKGVTTLLTVLEENLKKTDTELSAVEDNLNKLIDYLEISYLDGTAGLEYSIDTTTKTCTITGPGDAINKTKIIIPSMLINNIPVKTIGANAFEGHSLSQLTIGNNVTVISKQAFIGCSNLNNVKFNSNLKTIDNEAFAYCENINYISLPRSITQIGDNAFKECNLKSVYYYGLQSDWEEIEIGSGNDVLKELVTFIGD